MRTAPHMQSTFEEGKVNKQGTLGRALCLPRRVSPNFSGSPLLQELQSLWTLAEGHRAHSSRSR